MGKKSAAANAKGLQNTEREVESLQKQLENAKKEIEVQAAKAAQLEKELGSLGKEQLEALEQQRAIEAKAGRSLEQVEVWREREQQLLAEMRELRRDMAACQVQMIPPGLAVVLTCY